MCLKVSAIWCCCCSVARSCPTLCNPMDCSMSGFPGGFIISWSLFKPMSIESVMPSNRLILCRPLLLPPSVFPGIRVFSVSRLFASGDQSIGASASTSVLPTNKKSELISLRMDWLDLLAVQGTLKSLLQHHSSKASILWSPDFFTTQLSCLYITKASLVAQMVNRLPAMQETQV